MKERPILFSGPMVRAILAGIKTQTRRVVKSDRLIGATDAYMATPEGQAKQLIGCPYGHPGHRLWVREAFGLVVSDRDGPRPESIIFRADGNEGWDGKWRPSIHMPRWASRGLLEITALRVERLQEISEADALAEGARNWAAEQDTPVRDLDEARLQFRALWTDINGGESWDANPWVWVVEFKHKVT
jgi:hypothetical protein